MLQNDDFVSFAYQIFMQHEMLKDCGYNNGYDYFNHIPMTHSLGVIVTRKADLQFNAYRDMVTRSKTSLGSFYDKSSGNIRFSSQHLEHSKINFIGKFSNLTYDLQNSSNNVMLENTESYLVDESCLDATFSDYTNYYAGKCSGFSEYLLDKYNGNVWVNTSGLTELTMRWLHDRL